MPITLDGSNGIGTPDLESTGPITGTTGTFSGNVTANGLSTELRPLVLGTSQASTSGTNIDFTGIPSWVKRVTVIFNGVSTNGTSFLLVQLGAGSIVATGYSGGSVISVTGPTIDGANRTDGIVIASGNAANVLHGALVLANVNGNSWTGFGTWVNSASVSSIASAGSITLGGALDRIRITTVGGTNTFDAGTINIMYE